LNSDIITDLIKLSRSPRPEAWSATLSPLSVQLTVVTTRHARQRVEHQALADLLVQIDVRALVKKIVPIYLPLVSQLHDAGRDLRAALDSSFSDATAAVRDATSSTTEASFTGAIARARQYLRLAESTVAGVDRLVTQISALTAELADVAYVSAELVVPETSPSYFFAADAKGGTR
jgi:hypothetical protein